MYILVPYILHSAHLYTKYMYLYMYIVYLHVHVHVHVYCTLDIINLTTDIFCGLNFFLYIQITGNRTCMY